MTTPKQAKARSWVRWAAINSEGKLFQWLRNTPAPLYTKVRITVISRRGRGKSK